MTTIENKILAARTSLLWDHPFFGALAVQLQMVDRTGQTMFGTMETDGKNIYYDANFVEKLTKDELIFVMAHEIMHPALKHHTRRQTRKPGRWNKAADYAINGELTECKVGKMPQGGLLDDRYTGMGAEEIYRILDDEADGDNSDEGMDPGGCGAVLDGCGQHDEAAIAEAEAEMDARIRQAAAIAKGVSAGNMPGSVKRLIDQLTKPKVDWREVLRRFIDDNSTRKDFSWARPNRRMLPLNFIMPGQVSDGISHIVIAVDTSGSIDEKALRTFASEINGVFGDGGVDKLTVVYTDTAVNHVDEFQLGDEIHMAPHGGGGTHFDAAMGWVIENVNDATAMIFFTDGLTCSFGEEPGMPVMWTIWGDSRRFDGIAEGLPYGEPIYLEAA